MSCAAHSPAGVAVGALVALGAVASYALQAQHLRQLRRVDGYSYLSLLLNLEATLFALLATLGGAGDATVCLAHRRGVDALVAAGPAMLMAIESLAIAALALLVVYMTRSTRRGALLLAAVAVFVATSAAAAAAMAAGVPPPDILAVAGIVSSALVCVMWVPQIVVTLRGRGIGALSPQMLLLQAPGSLVVAFYIGYVVGLGWPAWAPDIVAGALAGALLVICYMRRGAEPAFAAARGDSISGGGGSAAEADEFELDANDIEFAVDADPPRAPVLGVVAMPNAIFDESAAQSRKEE
jgi:hypothetical protein